MVAPTAAVPGVALIVLSTVAWVAVCRIPWSVLRTMIALGLVMFLPFFVLVPLIRYGVDADAASWTVALGRISGVVLRGGAGTLVSMATISTMTISDFHEGLSRLPLPSMVTAILVQIVHQAATLLYETRRILQAVRVRGAAKGLRNGFRLLMSLPRVWLPRIIMRAERVAYAMELRDYRGELLTLRSVPPRTADTLVLVLTAGLVGLAVAVRVWSRT